MATKDIERMRALAESQGGGIRRRRPVAEVGNANDWIRPRAELVPIGRGSQVFEAFM